MRSWATKYMKELIVAAIIVVMMAPTVVSAARFFCIGEPVVAINGVTTKVVVGLELDARPVLRSEGKPVVITVTAPTDDVELVSRGQESFPIEVVFRRSGRPDVTVSVSAPDLTGYGEYSIELTVQVPSRQWEGTTGEVRSEAPRAKLTVPGNLF